MRVLGGRIILVEGGASRETQSGGEAWPNAARVLRQACSLTILTIDRDYPPDCRLHSPLEVAARDGPSRATVAAAVPRVVLDFTWAVHHQRLGGEGQVRRSVVRERRCCVARLFGGSFGTIGPGGTATETRDAASFFAFVPLDNRIKLRDGPVLTRGRCRPPQAAMPLCSELICSPKKAVAGSRPERTTPGGSSRVEEIRRKIRPPGIKPAFLCRLGPYVTKEELEFIYQKNESVTRIFGKMLFFLLFSRKMS